MCVGLRLRSAAGELVSALRVNQSSPPFGAVEKLHLTD
jgi:hypothetical protein